MSRSWGQVTGIPLLLCTLAALSFYVRALRRFCSHSTAPLFNRFPPENRIRDAGIGKALYGVVACGCLGVALLGVYVSASRTLVVGIFGAVFLFGAVASTGAYLVRVDALHTEERLKAEARQGEAEKGPPSETTGGGARPERGLTVALSRRRRASLGEDFHLREDSAAWKWLKVHRRPIVHVAFVLIVFITLVTVRIYFDENGDASRRPSGI